MAIEVHNGKISIQLDIFVKRYFFNSNFEYLLAAVHQLVQANPACDLEIVATVQTPLTLEPFAAIIDLLARVSQLPPSRITVKTKNRSFTKSMATINVPEDPEFFAFARDVITETEKLDFVYDANPKLFGALFGRCSFPRLDLARYLDTVYHDRSLITFHTTPAHVKDCTWGLETVFSQHIDWFKTWTNANSNLIRENDHGIINFPTNVREWPALWGKYYIEIVVETDYHTTWDWTEKTWKCLASGKPFIMMSGPGSLQEMRRLGFQTFHPWINECYDQELNAWKRLDLIKQEIARLADLERSELETTLAAVQEVSAHNKIKVNDIYV